VGDLWAASGYRLVVRDRGGGRQRSAQSEYPRNLAVGIFAGSKRTSKVL
jgi:hypothetical protein